MSRIRSAAFASILFLGPLLRSQDLPPPTPVDLVRGLRENGLPELALEYLAELSVKPPPDLAKVLPLERAKVRLELATAETDEGLRGVQIAQAKLELDAFLKGNPNHPRTPEAAVAIAQLLTLEGKTQLQRARREPDDESKIAAAAKARPIFDLAAKRYEQAASGLEKFFDRFDVSGQRVLELGCGSGRVGIGAALRGAQVVMTDVVGPAMLVSRFNARFVHDRVTVRRLEWKDERLSLPKFKCIIGSDLVYDPALHPILEPCLRRHLAVGGVVLLSEPQRHTGDRFRQWILSAGWQLKEHFVDLADGHRPIRIFQLSLTNFGVR